ncbi:MAG: AraC family transcriptional regulator [Spirochaetaceae bacterium]|nr:MAG: AraC family transcriptional regulator [Spirochaetaceae bacterium]
MRRLQRSEYLYRYQLPLFTHVIHVSSPLPMHHHDYPELAIVVEGTARHHIEDSVYDVAAGDVYLLPADTPHCFVESRDLVVSNVMFDLEKLGFPFREARTCAGFRALFDLEPKLRKVHGLTARLKLLSPQLDYLMRMQADLEAELVRHEAGDSFMALTVLSHMLGYLGRCYLDMPNARTRAISGIGSVMRYVELHYPERLTVEDLARASNMSTSTLHRHFRAALGASPIEYLIRTRVQHARDLLQETTLSVTEIGFECGFESPDYFSRCFRNATGLSPRAYRKAMP